ncbi:hypothetical protein CR205_14130 [Alteribacter lacisalsi]|uniref:Glycerophosphoryl diester phosphodiesterase membrane domain-containing protein n=1 Tax=Alteribacter lacisalsi TaxID=2045244 RepID=A0A2W0H4Q7_9BACI|nr:hypothetical protein [Alteribacter lacisalsi]PYZ96814.1 hypothetical protein CR205_14130 [Alteribacter lacisalsi]
MSTEPLISTVLLSFGNILYSFILFAYVTLLVLIPEDTANKDRRRKARRPLLRLFIPVVIATVLFFLIFGGGTLLFIIPGIIAFVFFLLFSHVITIENKTPYEALKRSAVLIKGSFFKAAGLFLIFLGAQALVVVTAGFYLPLDTLYLNAAAGAAAHILIVPFQAGVMTLLYMESRADHEAFDINVLRYEAEKMFRTKSA